MKPEKKFVFTTAIKKILGMKKRIKVIPGATSAGKTWAILPILVDQAIKNPNLAISVVSCTFNHLKKGAIRDFLNIMKLTGRYKSMSWNITNSTYTFANGSFIEFFSAEDEEKVRGPRRDVLYINEINKIKYEVYDNLVIRTNYDVFLDYNPTHSFWIDEKVIGDPDVEVLRLNYLDNEAIMENVKKMIEQRIEKAKYNEYWKNWVNVYAWGLPGKLEGVIFKNWKQIDAIPHDAKLLAYGMDFGVTAPTALVAIYKLDKEIIVDEIIYQRELHNADLAAIMKEKKVTGNIYADYNEPKTIAELRKYGFNIFPAKKGADSIRFGIQLMQEYNILITSRSKNLIREFERYSWKEDRDGNLTQTAEGEDHGIDATRYAFVMSLVKNAENSPFVII
jgi:phage terminase large subunit